MKIRGFPRFCSSTRLSPIAVLLLVLSAPLIAPAQPQPKRVLVLYWYNKDFPGNVLFDKAFQEVLKSQSEDIQYYPEYLESNRFPGDAQAEVLFDYLRRKYAGVPLDVIVPVSDPPTDFIFKRRKDFFPNTPVVFAAIKRLTPEQLTAGPGATGIVPANTHRETVELALNLHPDAKQLFVISGTPERDKRFEAIARGELKDFEQRVAITYLTDLSVNELVETTKHLPQNSVVLYVWQQSLDDQGRLLETWQTLASFAPTSSAPIYGMGSVNVANGIVGGHVVSSEINGTRLGEMVVQILNGKRAQDIPVENAPAVWMFNWRQLQRWGISEQRLPAGSDVRFREFTIWQQYKWRIVGLVGLIGLQTSFIVVLLIERKRRRRAKEELAQLNVELEQRIASRTAALDAKGRELEAFAYSVAHDLKAPLRGIDGYSRLLLEDHADVLNEEGRTFLDTIQSSTHEMSQLIDDLLAYSRLERRDFKPDRLELKPLITRVVEQTKREENERAIDFVLEVNGGTVLADPNGLTQALKNYVDNAVKFTRNVARPRIEIGVKETTSNCVLWVRDNGIGFDLKYHDRVFDIFQRLNTPEEYPGTGIGLAIVRKAMERMGGRAWAESTLGNGATFYLEIPK